MGVRASFYKKKRAGVDTRPYVSASSIQTVGATVHGRPRADLNGAPSVGPYEVLCAS